MCSSDLGEPPPHRLVVASDSGRGAIETVVGRSVKEAAVRTLYTNIDARAQGAALAMSSKITAMDDAELAFNSKENRPDRPWENYKQRLLKAQGSPR